MFKNLGATKRSGLGPANGIDGAVINMGKDAIVSMDPATGAVEHIGMEAVSIAPMM